MNWRHLNKQVDPPPGPEAEQARWIFSQRSGNSFEVGKRVVDLLLVGRDRSDLSSEELELLSRGYNWWGKHTEAFEVAKLNLARAPHCQDRFRLAGVYARIASRYDLPGFVAACDIQIAEGLGPAAFWHLLKADEYIRYATDEPELEDFEWSVGDSISHPELLGPAAHALEAALISWNGLREDESARVWVGDWNLRFAAVLQQPQFSHLAL